MKYVIFVCKAANYFKAADCTQCYFNKIYNKAEIIAVKFMI